MSDALRNGGDRISGMEHSIRRPGRAWDSQTSPTTHHAGATNREGYVGRLKTFQDIKAKKELRGRTAVQALLKTSIRIFKPVKIAESSRA